MPPSQSPKQIKSSDKDNGDTEELENEKPPSAIALEAASKANPAIQKKLLKTNQSKDDLNLKDPATLKPIDTHKQQRTLKSTIKKFNLDYNKITGLANFNDISKDPLALPPYAKPQA